MTLPFTRIITSNRAFPLNIWWQETLTYRIKEFLLSNALSTNHNFNSYLIDLLQLSFLKMALALIKYTRTSFKLSWNLKVSTSKSIKQLLQI